MTTVSRTNYATNPSVEVDFTGWSMGNGGGATTTATWATGAPGAGAKSYRATVTTAPNAAGFGPVIRTTTGSIPGASGEAVSGSVWVYASVACSMFVSLSGYTGATFINGSNGPTVTVPANTWTLLKSENVTITAAYDSIRVWPQVTTATVAAFIAGSTLAADAVVISKGTTIGTYFDGATAAVNNLAYQWTGTAGSSTSQEYYALPTILTVAKTDAPCPRTEVTVVGLGAGTTVFNVWRTADGTRKAVRGARNRSGVDSDFVVDYEAPLNRSLTYDIEVISGSQVTQPTYPATITVLSSTWWIQDPLVPSSAIPLNVSKQDSNAPYLTGNAIKSLEYGASVTLIPILGSTDPVALMGTRTIAGNVTFDMFTNLASVTTQLRNLIQQTPLLLIRSTGTRNNGIPGLAYFTSAKPSEKPVTVAFGGTLTNWSLTGDLVAAPTMNVLVPIWTYGTVAALWTTYQQAQTTLAAKTYLDVLKSPAGT